jgi:hypothetical protein
MGLMFSVYASWGVWEYRQWGMQLGMDIPAFWYVFAMGPPVAASLIAWMRSPQQVCWQHDTYASILMMVVLASCAWMPLIYVLYDFER